MEGEIEKSLFNFGGFVDGKKEYYAGIMYDSTCIQMMQRLRQYDVNSLREMKM